MKPYYDKHGKEILAGMTIRHDNGDIETVYATMDAFGNDDLGVMATRKSYIDRHPDCDIEYYSLANFRTRGEWEIVE